MYKLKSGYYGQGNNFGLDNFFWIGKVDLEMLFRKEIKVGERKEIIITQVYSFDDGPLKTQSFTYILSCGEGKRELPSFLYSPY